MRRSSASRAPVVDEHFLDRRHPGGVEVGGAHAGEHLALSAVASAVARASSGVGLPSRRSSPTGLPVSAESPNAPITSSRIWKASPSGSPNALSGANSSSPRSGAASSAPRWSGRSIVYFPLLYRAMRSAFSSRRSRCTDPRMSRNWPTLSSSRSSFHSRHTAVRHTDQQLVRQHEGEVADEDRHPLAEAAGLAGPGRPSVLAGVHGMGGRGAAPADGVVHHVVVEQREAVHQLERGAGVDHPPVGAVAAGADERPVAERRPQTLAAGVDHAADLVEGTGEIGVELDPALALALQQFVEPGVDPRARSRRGSPVAGARPVRHQVRRRCPRRGRRSPRRCASSPR